MTPRAFYFAALTLTPISFVATLVVVCELMAIQETRKMHVLHRVYLADGDWYVSYYENEDDVPDYALLWSTVTCDPAGNITLTFSESF